MCAQFSSVIRSCVLPVKEEMCCVLRGTCKSGESMHFPGLWPEPPVHGTQPSGSATRNSKVNAAFLEGRGRLPARDCTEEKAKVCGRDGTVQEGVDVWWQDGWCPGRHPCWHCTHVCLWSLRNKAADWAVAGPGICRALLCAGGAGVVTVKSREKLCSKNFCSLSGPREKSS